MKNYLMAVAVLAGLGSAGMAFAGDDCRVAKSDWQTHDAVTEMARKQGWTTERIKTDDGCYEIEGRDAQGREIEAKLDPATLAIIKVKYGDGECRVPMADWQPREAVQNMATAQGWTVRRIKTDDGCYEIKGRDGDNREIEVKVDPATLAIIEFEYEDDDRGTLVETNPVPAGAAIVPSNRLLTPGSKPTQE